MRYNNLQLVKYSNIIKYSSITSCYNHVSLHPLVQQRKQFTTRNSSNQQFKYKFDKNINNNSLKYFNFTLYGLFTGISLYVGYNYFKPSQIYALSDDKEETIKAGEKRNELPTYSLNQVKEHKTLEKGIWIVYKNGVYDITQFIESHPGGSEKILMAAGSSIEPFWSIYAVHHKNEVYEMLEELRIGNLDEKDIANQNELNNKSVEANDPFKYEPKRHPLLKVIAQKPFNAETPKALSADSLITPNELHFKRNHLPVPKIEIENYKIEIKNSVNGENISLKLDDIKNKFPLHTLQVTIQCAGNRRSEMHTHKAVQGLMWDVNAISTAEWTGVKLKDLLDYCGIDLKDDKIKHVHFEGLDSDPTGSRYGASIPKEKVLNEYGDVLIAFKMNGVDIPIDHGYPLRVVVPGVIGARSVKWLSKIILSDQESISHWQQKDYKLLSPTVNNLNEADFSKYKAVQEAPVQSAICEPANNSTIKKDDEIVKIKGYAFSGGGNSIESVLVTLDEGKTWKQATLKKVNQPLYRAWAWTLWELDVDIPKDKNNLTITCVATDSNENTQPETVKSIWNLRGLLNNSWHTVNVKLK